jgi:hypothetical protein
VSNISNETDSVRYLLSTHFPNISGLNYWKTKQQKM